MAIREFRNLLTVIAHKLNDANYRRVPQVTVGFKVLTIQKNGFVSTFSPEFAGVVSSEFSDFVIGNIKSCDSVDNLIDNPVYLRISEQISAGIQACADSCLYFDICGSGYISNKFSEHRSLGSTETTTCLLHQQILTDVIVEKLSQ